MRLNRAGEHAFTFGEKVSLWGRLFSILPWLPKVLPEWSEYNALRESAMKYYDCIKVERQLNHKCSKLSPYKS